MHARIRDAAAATAFAAAAASVAYAAFAIVRVRAFARRARAQAAARQARRPLPPPSVTILKPVRGLEPGLVENLASFCAQRYPAFDVVLGVLDPGDPALPVLRAVAARFPERTTVVAGDGVARHRNPKMATLDAMIAHATGEVIVIADSDMRVGGGYLDAVVAAFADHRVGAVTCVFGGEPARPNVASTLGAMNLTEQFLPSVLVANAFEPMTYCFGSTMAVRRDVFDAIGGIGALGPHLADDHALGYLVVAAGYRVALADYAVTNIVDEPDLRALVAHELRWLRTIRSVRRASYLGLVLTYPVPLALAALALARRRSPVRILVASALGVRALLRALARDAAGTSRTPPRLALARDALGVALWCAGLFGRSVRWRDHDLEMTAGPADDRLHATRGRGPHER